LAGGFFTTSATWEALQLGVYSFKIIPNYKINRKQASGPKIVIFKKIRQIRSLSCLTPATRNSILLETKYWKKNEEEEEL